VSLFPSHCGAGPDPSPLEGHLPSFDGAAGWLNSPPLAAADLRGKVVLVDFWTYTCINWLRTLSYVRAWAKKYEDSARAPVRKAAGDRVRGVGHLSFACSELRRGMITADAPALLYSSAPGRWVLAITVLSSGNAPSCPGTDGTVPYWRPCDLSSPPGRRR